MEYMYELKDKLCKELDEIARKPEMGAGDLEIIHKLTDTIRTWTRLKCWRTVGIPSPVTGRQTCAALMVVDLATVDASEILWAGIPARGVEVVVGTAATTLKRP